MKERDGVQKLPPFFGRDGIELILALRARWVPGHRVLLLTTVASSLASRLHKDALTGGYLCKPVQLSAFENLVKSINDFWLTEVKLPSQRESE